jgi:sigma-54 dependent transcriptional regulator, acetoin dehydrogenase operon transcriptional activator AcoR
MTSDTETLDLPGDHSRRSLAPADAGLLLLAQDGGEPLPNAVRLPLFPLVVGRDPPPPGLRITQGAVSKQHLLLTPTPDGVIARDLGSRNGTIVSGARISGDIRLAHGDLLHIGNTLFKYVASGISTFMASPARPPGFETVVAGPSLDQTIADLAVIAATDLSVLLLGETGTGKEVFARAVHAASGRRGRFVALNCAAIPPTLLEAELFGAKRGAFTGADRDREGLVRAADRGTLFLDEIGDMPLEAQAKMLRLIENKEVLPLGATSPEKSDARLVCATHRDLQELVASGRFRGDLLARIRQHRASLPPLRARKEDVGALFRHFLAREKRPDLNADFRSMVVLCHYDWPYNVRELEAVVRRAVALVRGPTLGERDLPEDVREHAQTYGAAGRPAAASVVEASVPAIGLITPGADELRALLAQHDGNVAAVARHFGKDRAQVHRWLRRHGIIPETFRS